MKTVGEVGVLLSILEKLINASIKIGLGAEVKDLHT